MSRRSPSLLLAPIALTIILGACSSSDNTTTTPGGTDGPGRTSGSTPGTPAAGEVREIEISLSDTGCEPRSIAATAGPTTFKVTNDGSAAVTEFEILEGGKILGEVENVIPGDTRDFSVTLKAGKYETYCPNGTQFERGTIEVADAPTGVAADEAARDESVETYTAFVEKQADDLITKTESFAAAVKAGDIDKSKQLFALTRAPYETIEPIAESFGDLDPAIDARDGNAPEGTEWGGFHRIEKALWVDGSVADLGPTADKLVADVKDLRKKIETVELEPAQMANGAVELLNEVSVRKITGEEDRYSHTDLSDFSANLSGAQEAFGALQPLLAGKNADLANQLTTRFTAAKTALDKFKGTDPIGNGFLLYDKLTTDDTKSLSTAVDALAEPLSTVAAIVIA